MKKTRNGLLIILLLAGAGFLMAGCETGDDPNTEGVESYFEENQASPSSHGSLPQKTIRLSVSASPSSLAADGNKAVIRVNNGTAPYSWGVQDINLGSIDKDSGTSIVYTRLNAGDNAITVNDRHGSVGNIVIVQP